MSLGTLAPGETGAWRIVSLIRQIVQYLNSQPTSVNPVNFGADPLGVNDSTAALNAALAVSNYVKFPPGHFIFKSRITYTTTSGGGGSKAAVTIEGSGAGVTVLDWNNSTDGLEIDSANVNANVVIRGLTIATNQSGAGVALTFKVTVLNSNAAVQRPSLISNVHFRGNGGGTTRWLTNINLQNVSNIVVDSCFMWDGFHTATGIEFTGNAGLSSPAVVLSVINTDILSMSVGVQFDALAQGLFLFNTNLTDNTTGILVPGSISPLTQMLVSNCQINPTTSGIGIDVESVCSGIAISGCLFIGGVSGGTCIKLAAAQYFSISGNTFGSSTIGAGTAISVAGMVANSGGSIIGNEITNFATGISLAASTDYLAINGNTLTTNTANISNSSSGTNNIISGNPGAPQAWTAYTATLAPNAGAITTQVSNSAYYQIDKLVHCRIDVAVPNIGTAVVPLTVTLPVTPLGSTVPFQSAVGRESANTGKSIAFRIKPGSTTSAGLVNYDGTDAAIANNSRYLFNFTYEVA